MQKMITSNWKRNIYALFIDTYPEILSDIQFKGTKDILVAAQLIKNNHTENPKITVENVDGEVHTFNLNLCSRTLLSKGNWMWIKQLNIYYPGDLLLNIDLDPRIIDIPYASNNSVCAYWLFKQLHTDLTNHLKAIYTHA